MGLILECYAIPPAVLIAPGSDPRSVGQLLHGISINSSAVEELLAPVVSGVLAGLDLAAQGPIGMLFEGNALVHLAANLARQAIDSDIANFLSDAVTEARSRGAGLWVGVA